MDACPPHRRRYARLRCTIAAIVFAIVPAAATNVKTAGATATSQPVIDANAPDPSVLVVGHDYYMFTTTTDGRYVPVWHSNDRVHWTLMGDAMPKPPSWARRETTYSWAPSVVRSHGEYLMYVTERRTAPDQLCIGVLESRTPAGPYESSTGSPLICTQGSHGAYDVSTYSDAQGGLWITWRDDALDAIATQRLAAGGRSLVGRRVVLLRATQRWEHGHIEGPSVVRVNATTMLLFYSAGDWRTSGYATGIAVCRVPAGTCTKLANPYMANGSAGVGPGGASVFSDSSGVYLVYAAWRGAPGAARSYRAAYVVRLWAAQHATVAEQVTYRLVRATSSTPRGATHDRLRRFV